MIQYNKLFLFVTVTSLLLQRVVSPTRISGRLAKTSSVPPVLNSMPANRLYMSATSTAATSKISASKSVLPTPKERRRAFCFTRTKRCRKDIRSLLAIRQTTGAAAGRLHPSVIFTNPSRLRSTSKSRLMAGALR